MGDSRGVDPPACRGDASSPPPLPSPDLEYNSRMAWDSGGDGTQIEEVAPRRASPGRGGSGGRVRRWLPVLAIGGLAAAIVGAGLLGPKPDAGTLSGGTPVALPTGSSGASSGPGSASGAPASPVAAVRTSGAPLADPYLLLDGRWVDLATGTSLPGESGCELDRPLVLAGGRIVCIVDRVTRSPGSKIAAYELGVLDLGRARVAPAEPWSSPPPAPPDRSGPAARLVTLTGRRDRVMGDPVAIAVAPGAEADSLLLAWAALGDDGYRVGLARFVVGDGPTAEETASREVLSVAADDGTVPSLGDLRVSASPGGTAALVGVTFEGVRGGPAVRRLVVVPIDAASADPGRILGGPRSLPTAATANAAGRSPLREGDATCGGSPGEGWADERDIYVVCPGSPAVVRRLALVEPDAAPTPAPEGAGGLLPGERPAGAGLGALVLDEIELRLPPGADQRSLRGNGEAVDVARGRYYRWAPWARTLWAVDLLAAPRSRTVAASVTLAREADDGSVFVPDNVDAAPRPVLALDPAADRVYAIAPARDGSGATVLAARASDLTVAGVSRTAAEPFVALGLGPDGALLYLATQPRGVAGTVGPRVAVQVLDTAMLTERQFAGLLPAGAWDPARPPIAR